MTSPEPVIVVVPLVIEMVTIDGRAFVATSVALHAVTGVVAAGACSVRLRCTRPRPQRP